MPPYDLLETPCPFLGPVSRTDIKMEQRSLSPSRYPPLSHPTLATITAWAPLPYPLPPSFGACSTPQRIGSDGMPMSNHPTVRLTGQNRHTGRFKLIARNSFSVQCPRRYLGILHSCFTCSCQIVNEKGYLFLLFSRDFCVCVFFLFSPIF